MGKRYGFLLKVMLLLIDVCLLNCCFIVAHWLMNLINSYWFLINLIACNILWFVSAVIFRLYKSGARVNMLAVTSRTVKTIILNILLQIGVCVLAGNINLPKHVLLSILCTASLLILASRVFIINVLDFFIQKAKLQRKTAIVGLNETGIELARIFQQTKSTYQFAGFFDNADKDYTNLSVNNTGQIVGSIDHCIDYAIKNDIREIYSTILPHQHEAMEKLMEIADQNCVRVRFVPDNKMAASDLYRIEYFDKLPVTSLRAEPLQNITNRFLKRAIDIAISSFALLFILSWLTPVIAVLIKLQSKGPVFFKQERSGKDNKPFWCYKFRSMAVNTESDLVQATKNDARITPIGSFLRKTSLDEFPQFWNVLKGDMSVVGPRPHMLVHTEIYRAIINKYMIRQFLKPGITGWAQANGYRGETENIALMEKRVEHDIWYMENWSPKLDVKILVRTLLCIFLKENRPL